MSRLQRLACRVFGDDWTYTDEYRNWQGRVQADRVCQRCGETELAWTGPTVDAIEEATGDAVPSKEDAYAEVAR